MKTIEDHRSIFCKPPIGQRSQKYVLYQKMLQIKVVMPAVHSRRVHLASLGRELPEASLAECNSLYSCRELSVYESREQGEGVQTRARIGRVLVKVWFFCFKISFFFQNFGFFRNFDFFFFENYDLPECICRLFLSDECVDDFGARHETTARRDTRPFDSCIADL